MNWNWSCEWFDVKKMRKMNCLKSDYIASDLKIIIIVFHAGGKKFCFSRVQNMDVCFSCTFFSIRRHKKINLFHFIFNDIKLITSCDKLSLKIVRE